MCWGCDLIYVLSCSHSYGLITQLARQVKIESRCCLHENWPTSSSGLIHKTARRSLPQLIDSPPPSRAFEIFDDIDIGKDTKGKLAAIWSESKIMDAHFDCARILLHITIIVVSSRCTLSHFSCPYHNLLYCQPNIFRLLGLSSAITRH